MRNCKNKLSCVEAEKSKFEFLAFFSETKADSEDPRIPPGRSRGAAQKRRLVFWAWAKRFGRYSKKIDLLGGEKKPF